MACNLLDIIIESGVTIDTGGTWSGPPPLNALVGDNPEIPAGTPPGTYVMTYTGGTGSCIASQQYTIIVPDDPNAGTNITLEACLGDTTSIDVITQLGGDAGGTCADVGPSSLGGALSGCVIDVGAIIATGTYQVDYTVSTTIPGGAFVPACSTCTDDTATLTLNVIDSFDAGAGATIVACD